MKNLTLIKKDSDTSIQHATADEKFSWNAKADDTSLSAHKGASVLDYPDESVTTAKLADEGVTTPKIADGAVVEDKIGSGAVTAAKLGASAVETAKITDGAVTAAKIGASAVEIDKIKDGAVTKNKIADGAISEDKLSTDLSAAFMAKRTAETKVNQTAMLLWTQTESSG